MVTADPVNITSVIKEIHDLEDAGCDIVRIAVPDASAVNL